MEDSEFQILNKAPIVHNTTTKFKYQTIEIFLKYNAENIILHCRPTVIIGMKQFLNYFQYDGENKLDEYFLNHLHTTNNTYTSSVNDFINGFVNGSDTYNIESIRNFIDAYMDWSIQEQDFNFWRDIHNIWYDACYYMTEKYKRESKNFSIVWDIEKYDKKLLKKLNVTFE
jgi:hypothetical protein